MRRATTLFDDAVVLAFGTLGGRVVGILLLPLYTYSLTRAEFGSVELVTTGIDLVLPLLSLSISEAVLRFAMTRDSLDADILRTALTFVGVGAVVAAIMAGAASMWWPGPLPAIIAVILVTQTLTLVLGAWCLAVGRVRTYAASGLTQAGAVGVANVVLLFVLDLGVPGFLLSLILGNLASAGVILVRLAAVHAVRTGSFDGALLRRMLLFSAPLVPSAIMWWLTNVSGRYFVALTHGVDDVGIFAVATRFAAIITMMTVVFHQAWQLTANRHADDDDIGSLYSRTFRYYAAALILTIATFVLVLRPVVTLVVAPPFVGAWAVVPPLLVGSMFAGFASFYGVIYTAARRSRGVFSTALVSSIVSVALNVVLVPRFGVIGAAVSIASCFFVLWIVRVRDSQRIAPTTASPRLLVPALAVLSALIGVQYARLEDWSYPLLATGWLLLIWILRHEVRDGVVAAAAAGRRRGSRRPPTASSH